MPSAQERLSGLAGSRGRAELRLPLLCCPQYFCGRCQPHGLSCLPMGTGAGMPWRNVCTTRCSQAWEATPMWTLRPCGQAARGTLSSLALGSCRDLGELFPSELESNQPQTKHPTKLSGEGPWRWREAPLAAFPCCAPRDHSPSLPPGTPCPARSRDRMASHPQRCMGGKHTPWVRDTNIWKKVDPLSSGHCCQVIILHLPVSMATHWLTACQ